MDEYALQNMGQVLVRIRPVDEYPLQNMGQVLVHGRIPLQKQGASIRPPTNNVSETWVEYLLVIRIGQTVRMVARILPVDKYNRYI